MSEENKDSWDYFDFERVKKHITKLPAYMDQIEYLVNIKTEYIQGSDDLPSIVKGQREFNELCDSEIIRLKELANLDKTSPSKFDEILKELKEIPRSYSGQIKFLIKARAAIIEKCQQSGKSFEEARENPDAQLCEIEVEKIKDRQKASEKRSEAFRERNRAGFFNAEKKANIFAIKRPGDEGTIEYFKEIERRKLEAKEEVEKENSEVENNDASNYGFNLAHKVHALLYLLKNSGVNINSQGTQAEVARFIKAITGQNYKNIYDLVLAHGFDQKKSNETHKKELRKVRDKFLNLRSNLEKAVQTDLERLEQVDGKKL